MLSNNDTELNIVSTFSYIGIVFPPGGSFLIAQKTLARQAQRAIFKLNCYLIKFTDVTSKYALDLLDKLVSPILYYAAEVWRFLRHHKLKGYIYSFQKTNGGKRLHKITLFTGNWIEQTIKLNDTLILLNTG